MVSTALRIPELLVWGTCALFMNAPALDQAETLSGAEQDRATEPGTAGPDVADAVPEGLSKGDWVGIRAAYEAGQHAVHPVEGGYQARNPGQRWLTRFDGHSFLTVPDTESWTWGLELERYGFVGSEQEVTSPARVSAEGGRVAYRWDATLEEWFVNDTCGLEHGYTVHRRPERDGLDDESPLTFTLAVRGDLKPVVAATGRGVRFVDEDGTVALTYTGLLVLDADGRELKASFEALVDGGGKLLLSVDERGARYPIVIDPIAQQAYLKASTIEQGDRFGSSVAVSGDTVVVGALNEDSNATGVNGNQSNNSAQRSGAAYVFVRSGTSWSQQAYLKASNTNLSDRFGLSVAVSDDTVVVGAYREASNATGVNGNQGDNSAPLAGAAYVFVRSGTSWSQEAYLKASNTDMFDEFGRHVAVSGDVVVVGARLEDSNATGGSGNQSDNTATDAGAAYVFERSGTSWSQAAYLKASNTDADDQFGSAVAVSGARLVVGAWQEDSNTAGVNGNQSDNSALNAGAAYVFRRSGAAWNQDAYLKASNTGEGDEFGGSVAISGDMIVVGAVLEEAAYVFIRGTMAWIQEAFLKASNTQGGDGFGWSVAASGDTVVVGAPFEDSGATSGVYGAQGDNSALAAGAAYVFLRNGGSWPQKAYLKAFNIDAGDEFGASVTVSGGTVVAGATEEDSGTSLSGYLNNNADAAGAAYVFVPGPGTSYCIATANSTGFPASMSGGGSASVNAGSFSLFAELVPADQNGVFFYGPDQTQVPFGNGFLCVAPGATGIARLPVVQADAAGIMTHEVDFSAPPTAATQITAGSTWNFQAWFRDPAGGGAFFNMSDGLEVTFEP